MLATKLGPGMRYRHDEKRQADILSAPMECEDRFGQPMVKVWAREVGTDREGWLMFGPDADLSWCVTAQTKESEQPADACEDCPTEPKEEE